MWVLNNRFQEEEIIFSKLTWRCVRNSDHADKSKSVGRCRYTTDSTEHLHNRPSATIVRPLAVGLPSTFPVYGDETFQHQLAATVGKRYKHLRLPQTPPQILRDLCKRGHHSLGIETAVTYSQLHRLTNRANQHVLQLFLGRQHYTRVLANSQQSIQRKPRSLHLHKWHPQFALCAHR